MNLKNYSPQQILFVVIIIVALFLRLFHLNYMEFKADEAFNSFKAVKFIEQGAIPLTSAISSTGVHEPPIFIYLLAIPFLFTTSPIFATGFIALLNVSGIALCYFFVKKFYNRNAALIAAAFYAVNPWQVLFSRKIWTQNLLAPFIMLFLYWMFHAIFEKNRRHIIYALITLGLVLQLHFSAAYIFILALALVITYWQKFDKRYLALGGVLFLTTFLPYLIFQVKNNFFDFHTAFNVIQKESSFHIEALSTPFRLMTTNGFDYSFGLDFSDLRKMAIKIRLLDFLSMFLLFLSIIQVCFDRKTKGLILIAWVIMGVSFLAFNRTNIHIHYFLSLLPLCFIMIGNLMGLIINKASRYWKYGTCFIVVILLFYQFAFSFQLLNFIKKKQCIHGDYGPPYAHRVKKVQEAIKQLGVPISKTQLHQVHKVASYCPKCDLLATAFIVKDLKRQLK